MRAVRFLLTGYRPALVAALGVALALVLLSNSLHSTTAAWRWLGVNSENVSFGDLRVITHSIPCAAAGADPYRVGSCDEYWAKHPDPAVPNIETLLNYPPIWLQTGRLGVSPQATNTLGIALALLAVCAFATMLRPRTMVGGILTLAAVLSPAVLLGVERGNIDLLIFAALVFTILATARLSPVWRDAIRLVTFVILTVLKLYPVACFTLFARMKRGWLLAVVAAFAAIGAAVLAAGPQFAAVLHNTPIPSYQAFGSLQIFLEWDKYPGLENGPPSGAMRVLVLLACVATVAVCAALTLGPRASPSLSAMLPAAIDRSDGRGELALAGLSVFALCFVQGASYDYRLIFLTCALPLLIQAYEDAPDWRRLSAPVAIVAFMWLSRVDRRIFFGGEILEWVIFTVGAVWILRNLARLRTAPART
jgi:Glycosyltransferase family 87